MDRIAQKEEGLRKSDGDGMGARSSGGGGGCDAIFNHGIDPHLYIMERLGDMTGDARLENLRIPFETDGREICLHLLSKGDCVRSCTRLHAPVRGHNQHLVIRYVCQGSQGSHGFILEAKI